MWPAARFVNRQFVDSSINEIHMADSTLSRRISEFVGVALFALALIWLIALVTYEPIDPVWFFTTDTDHPPANFVGKVGAFLAELSFQLFGYASYLLPGVIVVMGWHYFWCQTPDAAYTKLVGVGLFFGCASSFLSLILGSTDVAGKTFHAGGSIVLTRVPLALHLDLDPHDPVIVLLQAGELLRDVLAEPVRHLAVPTRDHNLHVNLLSS